MIKALYLVQEVSKKPVPDWDGRGEKARIFITTEVVVTLTPAFAGQSTPENKIFSNRPGPDGNLVSRGSIELRLSDMDVAAFFERKIGKDVTVTFE